MLTASRARIPHSDYWGLFDWFGRSCDQAAGLILCPAILIIYSRSLEDDLVRLSFPVTLFGVCWLLGAASGPFLQRLTTRVLPWIVGGFVVRTAAVVLLAYSASDRQSASDQRFRSMLICIAAYALSTGIARSSEARHVQIRSANESPFARSMIGTLGTSAILAGVTLAIWSILSSADLTWSLAFGRMFTLAAIALGVASIAAIIRGVESTELPPVESTTTPRRRQKRSPTLPLLAIALGAIVMVEGLALVALFTDFRRDSTVVRSSLALLAAGWVVGVPISLVLLSRVRATIVVQCALAASAIALIVADSLKDISATSWFPETIAGYDSVRIGIYTVAFLIGLAAALRRPAMARETNLMAGAQQITFLVMGLVAAIMPTVVAALGKQIELDWMLPTGIGIALIGMILAGKMSYRGPMRSPDASGQSGAFAPSPR